MKNHNFYLLLSCAAIIVYCGSSCEDDAPTPLVPCEWQVPQEMLMTDTCFYRSTTGVGTYVIPPTIGKETYDIAFDPTEEEVLYFTVWKREGIGGAANSEFYKLDLCENVLTYLGLFESFANSRIKLNKGGELLKSIEGGNLGIYDPRTLSLTNTVLSEINSSYVKYDWASDSTIWISYLAFPDEIGVQKRWTLYNIDGLPLDTLSFSGGIVSDTRNGKSAFTTYDLNSQNRGVYLYDNLLKEVVDSMQFPQDIGLPFFSNSKWLSDTEIIMSTSHMIAIADFEDQEYRILKEFSLECDNQQIESVAVVPNRPDEIIYVTDHYFYNEAGEYRKRHDLVHLNISTGEERVLVVE